MTFATKATAIRTYFSTRWTSLGDGTIVVYENVEYEPVVGTPFITFEHRPIDSTWVAPGWVDSIGAVLVSVFTPADAGPEAAETLATTAASCLSRQTDSGVQFEEATIQPAENLDDIGFFRVTLRTPYSYTEVAS